MIDKEHETIRAHRHAGKSYHWIAKECRRSLPYIYMVCDGIPLDTRSVNYRIGRYIGSNPRATNEQVAAALGFDVELIAKRRLLMRPRRIRPRVESEYIDHDQVDHGRRLLKRWMLANCSRGQKDVWQVLAIIGSHRITVAEIKASAIAAGLPVHPSNGLIGTPRVEPETSTTHRERRFKIGSLGRGRVKKY